MVTGSTVPFYFHVTQDLDLFFCESTFAPECFSTIIASAVEAEEAGQGKRSALMGWDI